MPPARPENSRPAFQERLIKRLTNSSWVGLRLFEVPLRRDAPTNNEEERKEGSPNEQVLEEVPQVLKTEIIGTQVEAALGKVATDTTQEGQEGGAGIEVVGSSITNEAVRETIADLLSKIEALRSLILEVEKDQDKFAMTMGELKDP
ncbi:hypothetical protein NE237_017289 [Protea cynaroides]|uniref:Uncharacterized protein n=1 Tax=Protea cynaroides TaxID=273540 RepID=A0A9Q0QMQ2_9MAGN|nr:hypothetical protein NE237_017289 [Protea cynaroides]